MADVTGIGAPSLAVSVRRPAVMSDIERLIAEFRTAVLAEEAAATQRVLAAYDPVRVELIQRIDALAKIIVERELTGPEALRLERAQALFAQVEEEIARLAGIAYTATNAAQEQMVAMAVTHSLELATASVGARSAIVETTWNKLNTGAVEAFVGRMNDGSPLIDTLGQFGDEARPKLVEALQRGIAVGTNPRAIAAELTTLIDGDAYNLLRISRTEVLSSYRSASLSTYAKNADVLSGWVWICALENSCAACVAMHGTEHELSERFFPSHPQCRCAPAPLVKGSSNPITTSGADWFSGKPASYQDGVLGKSGGASYRSGQVSLGDFVQVDHSAQWGDSTRQASVDQARANADERARRVA